MQTNEYFGLYPVDDKVQFAVMHNVLQDLGDLDEIDPSVFKSIYTESHINIGKYKLSYVDRMIPVLKYNSNVLVNDVEVKYYVAIGYSNYRLSSIRISMETYRTPPFPTQYLGAFSASGINFNSTTMIVEDVLTVYIGDKKHLISYKWVDRMILEESAFQSSTANGTGFNLGTIYEMLKILGIEK